MKFLIWVIVGFVVVTVGPQLLAAGGSPVSVGLGVLLMFFVAVAIARYLIGTMLGSIVGTVALIALVSLLFNNPRACSSSNLPMGDIGTVTEVARIGYLAESDYDRCLAGHVNTQSQSNPRLQAAAQSCQAAADLEVTRCLARVGEHWWNFDKEGSCRDEVSRTSWRNCVSSAIQSHADDQGNVAFGECRGLSQNVGMLRRIAGLFSGQSEPVPGSAQAINPASYDVNCLVTNYNANNAAISPYNWSGQLPRDGCAPLPSGSPAQVQCLVDSLNILGPSGVQVVNSCRR